MKHIYIFNSSARGTNYGVGTYIKQLVKTLKRTEYSVTVVNIIYKDIEFDIFTKGSTRYILIPTPVLNKSNSSSETFEKSIPFILYPYINRNEKNVFHLNYMGTRCLAENLRLILGGSIVLTVHYTDWSFSLMGNRKKLQYILKNEDKVLDIQSKTILKNLRQEKETLDFCDKIISISKHSYYDLLKIHKVDRNKILLINNTLKDSYSGKSTLQDSIIRKKLLIPLNDIVIVFAGRLDTIKGINILLSSFKCIVEKHPNARLFIAGEGDFNKWISASSPIWTRISFTGFLSKKDLYELYHIVDIGIVPSLHEEFGFVAVEMMSHEIPIIVNNTTGLSEIVDNNVNGLKVSINSHKKTWEELTGKINYLIENPDVRKKLGENARHKFKNNYNMKSFKKQILALYDSL